jgi:hypothetical protein
MWLSGVSFGSHGRCWNVCVGRWHCAVDEAITKEGSERLPLTSAAR